MQMKTDACVILALWAVGSKNFCLFGIDVMLDEKVPLFVCAVGIPPKWVVEKLHANGE